MDFSKQYISIQNSVIRVIALNALGGAVSAGSGVLIGDGSHAITCSHCIIQHTTTVGAFSGKNQGKIATVIYNDPAMDIAVIKFDQSLGGGVTIGDSTKALIGEEAFVVGFPMHTNTISALGANIAGFEEDRGNQLIMINTSVNHGNSGGPLFNSNGELIGIVNAKHGNLSQFLNYIEQANPQAGIVLDGINPVQVIQQLIREMKKNLNLGLGSAIPIHLVGKATKLVGDLIKPASVA